MESAYEELEKCCVCFILFNEDKNRPKILPCMHTICLDCLQSMKYSWVKEPEIKPENSKLLSPTPSSSFSSITPSKNNSSTSSSSSSSTLKKHLDKSASSKMDLDVPALVRQSQCPFCREYFFHTRVQDNRYIMVHLRQLTHLKAESVSQASAPPKSEIYDEVSPDSPEDFSSTWCTECECVATAKCRSHVTVALTEFMESQKRLISASLNSLETSVTIHSSSIEWMQKIFDDIEKACKEGLEEFAAIKKNIDDLQKQIKTLKISFEGTKLPKQTELLKPYVTLYQEMAHSSEWLKDYMRKLGAKISVVDPVNGGIILNVKENKTFVAKKNPDSVQFALKFKLH